MHAFKCAKCDSALHKQWANIFHCWNFVSSLFYFFSALLFGVPVSFIYSFIHSMFSFITWAFLSQTHIQRSLTHILCHLVRSLSAWVLLLLLLLFSLSSFRHLLLSDAGVWVSFISFIFIDCVAVELFAILSHRLMLDIEIFKWSNPRNVHVCL